MISPRLFYLLLLAIFFGIQPLPAQSENAPEAVRHYVVLIDGSASFRRAVGRSFSAKSYYRLTEHALANGPSGPGGENLSFRPGTDLVSVVFMHFPIPGNGGRVSGRKGFYIDSKLLLIDNLKSVKDEYLDFVEENLDTFKTWSVSLISLAGQAVVPALSDKLRKSYSNRSLGRKWVENLYVVTLSDDDDSFVGQLERDLSSFANDSDRRYFEGLKNRFQQAFSARQIAKQHFRLAGDPIRIKSTRTGRRGAVSVGWTELRPRLDVGRLRANSRQVSMNRVAVPSDASGSTEILWQGKLNLCFETGGAGTEAALFWATQPEEGTPWFWFPADQPRDEVVAPGLSQTCADTVPWLRLRRPETQDPSEAWQKTLWFRARIPLRDTLKEAYPLPFLLHLGAEEGFGKVAVTLKNGELEEGKPRFYDYRQKPFKWTDLFKSYEHSAGFIESDLSDLRLRQAFDTYAGNSQYKAYFKDGDLSSLELSHLSREIAKQKKNAFAKRVGLLVLAFLLLITCLALGYAYFLRLPRVEIKGFEALKDDGSLMVNFGGKTEPAQIATFELVNTRSLLSPERQGLPLKLSLGLKIEFKKLKGALKLKRTDLLEVIHDDRSAAFKPAKAGGLWVELKNVIAGDLLKIQLNPSAFRDLDAEQPELNVDHLKLSYSLLEDSDTKAIAGFVSAAEPSPLESWEQTVLLEFLPQDSKLESSCNPASSGLEVRSEGDRHIIHYSGMAPRERALYDLILRNRAELMFSRYAEGQLTLEVLDDKNKQVEDLFLLWDSQNRRLPSPRVRLGRGEDRRFGIAVDFEALENPRNPKNYSLNLFFHDQLIRSLYVEIRRSTERTEPLIHFEDPSQAGEQMILPLACRQEEVLVEDDRAVLLRAESPNLVQLHNEKPFKKDVSEMRDTEVLRLQIRNHCNTGAGYFDWELVSRQVESTHEKVTLTVTGPESGRVMDRSGAGVELRFKFHKDKVSIKSYQLSFSLRLKLRVLIFADGDQTNPAPQPKIITAEFKFRGVHEVADRTLFIDFGTSAIAVVYYVSGAAVLNQKARFVDFPASKNDLKEDGRFLPSILNLTNSRTEDAIIKKPSDPPVNLDTEPEKFVMLPAHRDCITNFPELVIPEVKLLIVKGYDRLPFDGGKLKYGDHEGFPFVEGGEEKSDYPKLENLLRGAYTRLKQLIETTPDLRDYRKLVVTVPNVYNSSHERFLLDKVIHPVFEGRVYRQNIQLVSESDAVAYYFMSKRETGGTPTAEEHVLIVDIGAGTMDLTVFRVNWNLGDQLKPEKVRIHRRDGIALAGEVLDKAIALQTHQFLREFDRVAGSVEQGYKIPLAGSSASREHSQKLKQISTVFKFKTNWILAFKKAMAAQSDANAVVKLCLGLSDLSQGLFLLTPKRLAFEKDHDFQCHVVKGTQAYLEKDSQGRVWLCMPRAIWLEQPFLRRFQALLEKYLQRFMQQVKAPFKRNLLVVLSGRTSLWPGVSEAVAEVLPNADLDSGNRIWGKAQSEDLKTAVVFGAIQKTGSWRHLPLISPKSIGVPAVRYQKGLDPDDENAFEILPLGEDPIPIDLANAENFQLGTKTSMSFTPFRDNYNYPTEDYCKKNRTIKLRVVSVGGKINGYEDVDHQFWLRSDRNKQEKSLQQSFKHQDRFLDDEGSAWPIKTPQLADLKPDEFDHHS